MSQGTPSMPSTSLFTPGSLFNPGISSTPNSELGQSATPDPAKTLSPTKTTTTTTTTAATPATSSTAPVVAPIPPSSVPETFTSAAASTPGATTAAAGVSGTSSYHPPTPTLNFRQIDNAVAKLIHTVNDHEKEFIALATRTNFYDQMIMENAQKITYLTQASENIKHEQQKVENIMEATSDSQNELEAMIVALEESLPKDPRTSSFSEPQNRVKLYDDISKFDDELRQMSVDLTEIITHANLKNRSDSNDPISCIIKVMNQHTDTLQWIDKSTDSISKELQNLANAQQNCRRSQERVVQHMFRQSQSQEKK